MAITIVHYCVIRDLFEKGMLPKECAILEIGEANVYGELHPQVFADDIKKYVADPQRREALQQWLDKLVANKNANFLFDLAKLFYALYFAATDVLSIDLHGTGLSQKLDLNLPVTLNRKFDLAINHGTAEHIFNIAQVFRTMHDYTLPGGMMIHEDPFTGWIEHGFYNLQPTLFFDLAEFNQYEIVAMFIEDYTARSALTVTSRQDVYELARDGKIPANSSLFVVFRKSLYDRPFQVPIQGYYRQALPEGGMEAWNNLR